MDSNVVFTYRADLIDGIDRQIEELKRRKDAIQNGYCYIPGMPIFNSMHGTLEEFEKTEDKIQNGSN